MKNFIRSLFDCIHHLCWIVPVFLVLFYVKENKAKNTILPKLKNEHKIDSASVSPCEFPAYLVGYEDDTVHISKCISPGRVISVSGKLINLENTKKNFLTDTVWNRDTLIYLLFNTLLVFSGNVHTHMAVFG